MAFHGPPNGRKPSQRLGPNRQHCDLERPLKRGWRQDEFVDRAGLHRTQVGAFETGRMNITLASYLVAQTLGVRIVDLFKAVEDESRGDR